VFLNSQGNSSNLGLDLNDIIVPIPKKNIKLSRLAFSFAFDCIILKNILVDKHSKIFYSHTSCKK
jgi:hypothetical protein